MKHMTDSIRQAVKIEMVKRDWRQQELADAAELSRPYISELLNAKAGNINPAWEQIFDALGLELVVRPKPDA